MMKEHKQIAVKVNAYVDEAIAELVGVLNDIQNVSTFSSCGGEEEENAHIYFFYGEPYKGSWLESAQFANKLAKILANNDSYDSEVSLEWNGDKDAPFISIELYPNEIKKVFKILFDHMNEFSYDTLCKELHSSIECRDHWS